MKTLALSLYFKKSLEIHSCFPTAGAWLFLDETLVKKKNQTSEDDHDPDETSSSENSSDQPQSNDSLLQPGIPDASGDEEEEEEREDEMHLFEIDDSESATDSEYDATSDTELLRTRRTKRTFNRHLCQHYKSKCLQAFSISKLACIFMRRITDCIGGFVTCAMCLWSYDYTMCKPHNLKRRSSGCGKALCSAMWRTLKLVLDRKVLVSVSLYGIFGSLAIVSNEVIVIMHLR